MEALDQAFWIGLAKIIGINIVLSGDNAVVIALAARSLPAKQQKQAIFWGSGAAIVMRIVLTVFAVKLLALPWLKLIGSMLLVWIGIQLLLPEDEGDEDGKSTENLAAAIKTILIADLVMSLDNVIAVAAAAGGSLVLLIAGLAISIPLVIFGSTLLLKAMERFPVIITIGGGLLGFVAGEMLVSDPALEGVLRSTFEYGTDDQPLLWGMHLGVIVGLAGAALVVGAGKFLASRKAANAEPHPLERVEAGGDRGKH
jgi:YjbE family integral membrane protein